MNRIFLAIVSGIILSACQAAEDKTPAPTPTPLITPTETPTPAPTTTSAAASLEPGKYCYFLKNETSTEGLQLTILENGSASAQYFGTIHNDASAYYAAFETQLSNASLDNTGKATFSAITEVDGDTQHNQETWQFSKETATSVDHNFSLTTSPCATLMDKVWPQVE